MMIWDRRKEARQQQYLNKFEKRLKCEYYYEIFVWVVVIYLMPEILQGYSCSVKVELRLEGKM